MPKNILITGAAKRIGAACARLLHQHGCNLILHYRSSDTAAAELAAELNTIRPDSAHLVQADLLNLTELKSLAWQAEAVWGGIDVLVNNASAFYPTPLAEATEANWEDLLGSNLKAPFFLSQALADTLSDRRGCIINIIDIHAERGLQDYPIYSVSKAGLAALTRILAKEMAPRIRVNGVAPGAILWPEAALSAAEKTEILNKIPLGREGSPEDIAKAVWFLANDAGYITGQLINVDGGRLLYS